MADDVTTNVLFNGRRRYGVHLTCISDGTGETTVTKVDATALRNSNGKAPGSLSLTEISFNVEGFTNVVLYWSRTAGNEEMVVLKGRGAISYEHLGGLVDPNRAASGTGSILLTSNGASSGATYQIDMKFKLKK